MRSMIVRYYLINLSLFFVFLLIFSHFLWAEELTPPDVYIGHPVGADYKVADWDKMLGYFNYVSENSDRVNVREIGTTMEGRPYIVAEISSSDAIRNRDCHLNDRKMVADPRLIKNEEEERRLIEEGKVVVYFGCAIHGNEVGATQMSLEVLYDLATGTSPEIQEILDRVILVMIPSNNPDGHDNMIDWYERTLGKPWEGSGMPWLYSKYAGNQNVWDTVHLNLNESRADARILYQEWFPNILCDIHQWGSTSARILVPPHSDPTNPNLHPLHNQLLFIIGGYMQAELLNAGKKGVVSQAIYSTYESGIPRYTAARHNMVGFLTEAASVRFATPVFITKNQLNPAFTGITTNMPDPWPGGWWRLRDIVDYEKIAYMGVLKVAARNHELFQRASIIAARDAIQKGQTEPPFAWLVPAEQHDPGTTAHMLEILHFSGVEVHRAEEAFTADGVEYPPGTFILYCAQPFRTYVKDLFERQDPPTGPRPNRFEGWTLPLQMGVKRIAVNQPFECKVVKLESIPVPKGGIQGRENSGSYVVRACSNDEYRLINRMHKEGIQFSLVSSGENWKSKTGSHIPAGSLFIHEGKKIRERLPDILTDVSSNLIGGSVSYSSIKSILESAPSPRAGLYKPWMEALDEGWTRLVLDTFEFTYSSVHNAEIKGGNLRERYDCLILPSLGTRLIIEGRAPDTTEPQYVGGIGLDGIINLQYFVQDGGTLVCIDESCNLPIEYFTIPVRNILQGKSHDEFFCRGSCLRIFVDTEHPVGYGLQEKTSAYFYDAQAFEIVKDGDSENKSEKEKMQSSERSDPVSVVARYADTALVESGRIRAGEDLISGKPAIVEVKYGKGRIVLLGFRIHRNAQTHGTFRFLFNAIQRSTLSD